MGLRIMIMLIICYMFLNQLYEHSALSVFSELALGLKIAHDTTLRNFYSNNYLSLMEVNDNVCVARLNNRFMLYVTYYAPDTQLIFEVRIIKSYN